MAVYSSLGSLGSLGSRGASLVAALCVVSWIACTGGNNGTTMADSAASSGGSSSSGSSSSSSDGSSTGDGTGSTSEASSTTEDTSSTGAGTCELNVDLSVLVSHLADLQQVCDAVTEGASDLAPIGFLAAPGYSDSLLVAVASPLQEACAEASILEPECTGDQCWQVSCTGDGAGWSLTAWVDQAPAQSGDYTFSELSVTVSSAQVAGDFTFQISSTATKGPEAWGVAANGSFSGGAFDVVALLPEIIDGHETVLIAAGSGGAFSGTLEVDNVAVADVASDGTITPTGACW